MLVALGAALFVIAPAQAGLGAGDLGRIIQGVAAGIGSIGAGTILKLTDREEIKGLTTAASIWPTAAPVSQRPSVHCGCRLSARPVPGSFCRSSHTSKQNQPPSPRAVTGRRQRLGQLKVAPPGNRDISASSAGSPAREGLAVDDPRWIALHAGPVARRRPRVLGPAGLHSMHGRRLPMRRRAASVPDNADTRTRSNNAPASVSARPAHGSSGLPARRARPAERRSWRGAAG